VVPNNQIRWYAALTGGSQLASSTILSTGTYYATQGAGGCQSSPRIPIRISIVAICTAHTITATVGNGGAITPSGNISVIASSDNTFKFTPNSCYEIDELWIDGVVTPPDSIVGITGFYTFENVTTDHAIHVTFKTFQYTITATAGANGTITPTATVNCGDHKTFYFTPKVGYHIDSVFVNDVFNPQAVEDGYYTFMNVKNDATIHATFAINVYTITVITGPHGTINPSENQYVFHGDDSPEFIITPNFPYRLDQVLIDGVNDEDAVTNGSYTFINVTSDHTIEAIFACPFTAEDLVNNDLYNVVTVAGICWTKENLRARLYHDGTPISFAKPYYHALYPDVENNEENFGLLYDWYSALNVENLPAKSLPYIQGICPDGWRLPTSEEFAMLNIYPSADLRNKIFWLQPHHNTNITGFDSRGAGYFNSATQRFEDLYGFTAYWSSDDQAGTISTAASFTYYCNLVEIVTIKLTDAISVRCVAE